MKRYKILIADDESRARQLIVLFLGRSGIDCTLFEAANGLEAVELISRENPEILFLDMKMPGLSGTEVLAHLDKNNFPVIIFTTAFDEYALQAFDFDAVDYLLKPFDYERFLKAFQKALDYIEYFRSIPGKEKLETLAIKTGSRTLILKIQDIDYFLSDGPYVQVHKGSEIYLIHKPLYELNQELPADIFLRVHRSCILNIHAVIKIKSLLNGDYTIILRNKKEIRASRTYRESLRSVFGKI